MELHTSWIHFRSGDQDQPGYLARPAMVHNPLPAVIVIQEIWGVDGHIRDLTERFAAAGYVALAPDLYAEHGARPEALGAERVDAVKAFLDSVPPGAWMNQEERDRALDRLPAKQAAEIRSTLGTLFSPNRDMARYLGHLRAAFTHLRTLPECRGRRVGCSGYCLGGALAAELACSEPELGAAAIYYGSAPAPDRLAGIGCPVAGFYGADDHRITDAVPAFTAAMAAAGKTFTPHVYPDTPHAFFNDTRSSYRPEAARDAWARTLTLFAEHLTPSA